MWELKYKAEFEEISRRLNDPNYQTKIPPRNAFKYPNDPDAVFPQCEEQKNYDLRHKMIPNAGYEFRGANRKEMKR